ncbi:hypothetical protein F7P83_09100 [Brevibacterium luteolum]|nr:hypothetical protein [Brevibacterium luteolum]
MKVQAGERSHFADDTNLGEKATITDAVVTGELSMGDGATVKGGKEPATLDGDIAIGADATLTGAIRVRPGVEIGESARVDSPSGRYPEGVTTEIDADCEVLDRARIRTGVRLGERTLVGTSAEVGAQAVTAMGTEIGDRAIVGDFSRLNGSVVSDDARIGHGVETGHAADVGERSVIEDNAVIEAYARVEDDGYVCRGEIVREATTTL